MTDPVAAGGRHRWRRWRWPARVLAVAGSALALWLVLRRVDLAALGATFRTMRPWWYLLAHLVFGLGLLGSAIRWHLMLRLNPQAVVHASASVRMVFISQFFNTVFGGPSGGDLPKTAVYSKWFGVPASDVLAASVLDRLVASVGGLAFAVLAFATGAMAGGFQFLSRWQWRSPGAWLPWVIALAVAVLGGLLAWGAWRPESFVGRLLRTLRLSARRLVGSARRSGQAFACAVVTAVLFNLTQVLCLQAVSAESVPWLKLIWMFYLVTFVAALPITVAGTGLREGAAMVLLAQYGIPATTAVAGAMLTLSVHVSWALLGAFLLAREQRLRRGRTRRAAPETVSAVVPTLNEAAQLAETVECLRAIPEITEIVVADGGSSDGTPELAERLGCRVITTARGRGVQLKAGAEATTGEVILLVHADTWLARDAGASLLRCLRDPLVVGGGFWKRFRNPPWLMRGARPRCWLRLWWSGRVLGDQAMFVRRSALAAVGGVPSQPLMEEIELCRRLRREGRLVLAGAQVTASERRFTERGVLRTYWLMWRVSRAYRRGVPPEELARRYEQR